MVKLELTQKILLHNNNNNLYKWFLISNTMTLIKPIDKPVKLKSIDELINEKGFFNKESVTGDVIVGLALGYIMEKAGIPDFTAPEYDFNSKKVLYSYGRNSQKNSYRTEIDEAYACMTHFFAIKVWNADIHKYHDSHPTLFKEKFRDPAVIAEYQCKAFQKLIESEERYSTKIKLQFMELEMLSRLPSLYKEEIISRFDKLQDVCIPPKLIPIYDLAKQKFVEVQEPYSERKSIFKGLLGLISF